MNRSNLREYPSRRDLFLLVLLAMATRIIVIPGGPGFGVRYLDSLRALLRPHDVSFFESSGPRMADHVRQVEAARRESRAGLILGHSFGGLVACHHALAFPEAAEGLILLDPDPARHAEWDAFRSCVANRRRPSDEAAMKAVAEVPDWTSDPERLSAYFRSALAPYFANPELAAELDFGFSAESMNRIQSRSKAVRGDIGDWDLSLERIPIPTLLIHGAESVFSPSSPETLGRVFPAGESHVLSSVGHFPHIEAAETVRILVTQFLAVNGFTT